MLQSGQTTGSVRNIMGPSWTPQLMGWLGSTTHMPTILHHQPGSRWVPVGTGGSRVPDAIALPCSRKGAPAGKQSAAKIWSLGWEDLQETPVFLALNRGGSCFYVPVEFYDSSTVLNACIVSLIGSRDLKI